MTGRLTHFDDSGAAHMVDVSEKDITSRVAIARGMISMAPATFGMIQGNPRRPFNPNP